MASRCDGVIPPQGHVGVFKVISACSLGAVVQPFLQPGPVVTWVASTVHDLGYSTGGPGACGAPVDEHVQT
jgi:hypothetical protein